MKLNTEAGQKAKEVLMSGGAVPEELVLQIIEDKIRSPEVAHCGVFCFLLEMGRDVTVTRNTESF